MYIIQNVIIYLYVFKKMKIHLIIQWKMEHIYNVIVHIIYIYIYIYILYIIHYTFYT